MSDRIEQQTPSPLAHVITYSRETQWTKRYGVMLFLLLLVAVSAFLTPNFLSKETFSTTLRQSFPVVLAAMGMTLVIASGGIDISVGAIMALSAVVTAVLCAAGMTPVLAIGCGLLTASLCGAISGALIAKCRIQPIIITLAVMFVSRAFAQMIAGESPVNLPEIPFELIGLLRIAGIPIQVMIIAVLAAFMVLVTRRTVFGRRVEAIGDNRTAARLVGIDIVTTTVAVYAFSGLLCGIAGNMESAKLLSADPSKLGRLIELDAIAAVAIGGTSFSGGRARIAGTVLGAIVIQLIAIIVAMNDLSYHYSLMLKASILVLAVWVQREK